MRFAIAGAECRSVLVPEQLVDAGLGPGAFVDGLHDHRAVGGRQALVRAGAGAGQVYNNRLRPAL